MKNVVAHVTWRPVLVDSWASIHYQDGENGNNKIVRSFVAYCTHTTPNSTKWRRIFVVFVDDTGNPNWRNMVASLSLTPNTLSLYTPWRRLGGEEV
jgi:hypothetical protein